MASLSRSASDWEREKQHSRRAEYLAANKKILDVWQQRIASRSGPLPGATLDPFVTLRGWCGHVQATIMQAERLNHDGRRRLADAICDAYQLPRGAVLVDHGWRHIGDTAFIWAYTRPGMVDHHERLPHSVFGQEFAGRTPVPGQLTTLEESELKDWARKHKDMLDSIRAGRPVDMEQVNRRYNRMRGAVLDALTRASVAHVRGVILASGLDHRSVGEDIGELLEMPR